MTESNIRSLFAESYSPDAGEVTVCNAPGRVNLIGEHTDYNDGYVLPVPIDRYVWLAGTGRDDDVVSVHAVDYGESASFNLGSPRFDERHLWLNYVQGLAWALQGLDHELVGANLVVRGDVPQGAGLSSSAALEVASARMFTSLSGIEMNPIDLAYACKRAENEFVGVQCGVMDQFVASLGRRGMALFIDCRTNENELLSLPDGYRIVVVDTTVKRELAFSAYNERRGQCEEAVRRLRGVLPQIEALRDVSPEKLHAHKGELDDLLFRRCRHVVDENARVIEAVDSLRREDMETFGALMYLSHESLRDDYEVSCRELDVLVESARGIEGVVGARMTGAGFGGCTVNVVEEERVARFKEEVRRSYLSVTGLDANVYVV